MFEGFVSAIELPLLQLHMIYWTHTHKKKQLILNLKDLLCRIIEKCFCEIRRTSLIIIFNKTFVLKYVFCMLLEELCSWFELKKVKDSFKAWGRGVELHLLSSHE